MPKSKMLDYWESVGEERIKQILKIIEDNKNIKDEILIAKIHIEPPYLDSAKSMDIIRDLKIAGKIKVNEKGEITLCH